VRTPWLRARRFSDWRLRFWAERVLAKCASPLGFSKAAVSTARPARRQAFCRTNPAHVTLSYPRLAFLVAICTLPGAPVRGLSFDELRKSLKQLA
jgi:hypothetical protein